MLARSILWMRACHQRGEVKETGYKSAQHAALAIQRSRTGLRGWKIVMVSLACASI